MIFRFQRRGTSLNRKIHSELHFCTKTHHLHAHSVQCLCPDIPSEVLLLNVPLTQPITEIRKSVLWLQVGELKVLITRRFNSFQEVVHRPKPWTNNPAALLTSLVPELRATRLETGRLITGKSENLPTIAVSGKGQGVHYCVLVVVELCCCLVVDDNGLHSLALDLVDKVERKVDLRLDRGHKGAVGDGSVGANHHCGLLVQHRSVG